MTDHQQVLANAVRDVLEAARTPLTAGDVAGRLARTDLTGVIAAFLNGAARAGFVLARFEGGKTYYRLLVRRGPSRRRIRKTPTGTPLPPAEGSRDTGTAPENPYSMRGRRIGPPRPAGSEGY
jgi:hypothetical protein